MTTRPDDATSARELLDSSEQLRGELADAVVRLDAYIEQLRDALPQESTDERSAT